MSILSHIDHILNQDGVLAVCVRGSGTITTRGVDHLATIAVASLDLLDLVDGPEVRALVGQNSIAVMIEAPEAVSIIHPIGHPVAKSLRRMIRRSARRETPPVRTPKAEGKPKPAKPRTRAPRKPKAQDTGVSIDYIKPLPTEPTRPF